MARGNTKLYRIKKEMIKDIPVISNYYVEKSFSEGYCFIRETKHNANNKDIHMINTTVSKKRFTVTLVECEVVEEQQ